jgi:hypothetical protein
MSLTRGISIYVSCNSLCGGCIGLEFNSHHLFQQHQLLSIENWFCYLCMQLVLMIIALSMYTSLEELNSNGNGLLLVFCFAVLQYFDSTSPIASLFHRPLSFCGGVGSFAFSEVRSFTRRCCQILQH